MGGQARVRGQQAGSGEQHDEAREAADTEQVLEEAEQALVGVLGVVDDEHDRCPRRRRPGAGTSSRPRTGPRARRCRSPRHPAGRPAGAPARPAPRRRGRRRRARGRAAGRGPPRPPTAPCRPAAAAGAGPGWPRPARSRRPPRRRPGTGRCASGPCVLQPVDVLLELPAEPGLADPGLALDHQQRRVPGLLGAVEQLLDQPQLAVAADQRRLEPVGPLGAAHRGHHGADRPQRHRVGLALHRVAADVDVGDRRGGQQPGRLVDPDLARGRRRLHPRRGVDRVAGDHALLGGADGHGHLAGHDADPHREVGRLEVVAHRGHAVDQLETGADRALGVVLVGGRHAPDRHHRVADELLDGAAVALDDPAALLEVRRQQLAHVLLVALSDSEVKPTRSPNSTLVIRRVATGVTAASTGPRRTAPRRSSGRTARRPGARRRTRCSRSLTGVPHEKQNRAPSARAVPQAAHALIRPPPC